MTACAYALIDSYVDGFALHEANLPATGGQQMADLAESIIESLPAGEYPHLMELTAEHILQPGYDFAAEFEFGLDLILDILDILDSLEAAAKQARPRQSPRTPRLEP